jgi:hypothetical protein
VFYQSSHLRRGRRSGAENNYTKIQLWPLWFLRVPGTNTPHSYHTSNNTHTHSAALKKLMVIQTIWQYTPDDWTLYLCWMNFFHNLTKKLNKKLSSCLIS